MAIWGNGKNQAANQGQQNMSGGLGNGALTGLGSGYLGQGGMVNTAKTVADHEKEVLRSQVHSLQTELKGQQSVRAMDQVLLRRHYRIWQWLKDVHPEVIQEFEAMEDLLKASGEKF